MLVSLQNNERRNKERSASQRWLFIGIAAAILVIAYLTPTPEGLDPAGKMGLALLLAGLVLWVSDVMSVAISTFAIMGLMYVFSVATANDIWHNWSSSPIFFVLAAFGISTAMTKTDVPNRIVFALLKMAKGKSKRCIFAFMTASWLVSMVISDFAATALLSGIAVSSILAMETAVPGKSKLGKCLLIGIPIASVVGGGAMPTGSAVNIMAMSMLHANTGISISFLDWTAACLPISIVLMLTSFFTLTTVFKPEPISQSTIQEIQRRATESKSLSKFDKKFLIVLGCVLAVWITSHWTGWDATVIALVGLVVFFLPGINLLTWDEYKEGVSWEILMMVGGVTSLATSIQEKGAGAWLYNVTAGKLALGASAAVISAAVFLPLVKLFLPIGPALIAVFMIPLTTMATALGISPVIFTIMIGVNASNTFLLGLDANHMITYKYKYWSFVDFFKTGVPPTIVLMLMHSFVLPQLVTLLGY
jgi:sodium-dependent dicarboxylate transporter 2/3/5